MHDCTWSSHSIPALCVCLTVFLSVQLRRMKHLVFISECWETGPVSVYTHTHTWTINKIHCDLYNLVQRFLSECVTFGLKHTLTHTFMFAQSRHFPLCHALEIQVPGRKTHLTKEIPHASANTHVRLVGDKIGKKSHRFTMKDLSMSRDQKETVSKCN